MAGLTLLQAKVAIERVLAQYVLDPEVTVDVRAYNSKDYFGITDGAGYGQQVYRFPITGNDTVLRAISFIQGLPVVARGARQAVPLLRAPRGVAPIEGRVSR